MQRGTVYSSSFMRLDYRNTSSLLQDNTLPKWNFSFRICIRLAACVDTGSCFDFSYFL